MHDFTTFYDISQKFWFIILADVTSCPHSVQLCVQMDEWVFAPISIWTIYGDDPNFTFDV